MGSAILVAVDGSPIALKALGVALDLASSMRTPAIVHAVSVVHYITPPGGLGKAPADAPDLLSDEAESALAAAREYAELHKQTIVAHVARGAVVDAILELARELEAAYIVAGTHGRKGLERAIMGSTCDGLVRRSDIPVITVHGA